MDLQEIVDRDELTAGDIIELSQHFSDPASVPKRLVGRVNKKLVEASPVCGVNYTSTRDAFELGLQVASIVDALKAAQKNAPPSSVDLLMTASIAYEKKLIVESVPACYTYFSGVSADDFEGLCEYYFSRQKLVERLRTITTDVFKSPPGIAIINRHVYSESRYGDTENFESVTCADIVELLGYLSKQTVELSTPDDVKKVRPGEILARVKKLGSNWDDAEEASLDAEFKKIGKILDEDRSDDSKKAKTLSMGLIMEIKGLRNGDWFPYPNEELFDMMIEEESLGGLWLMWKSASGRDVR